MTDAGNSLRPRVAPWAVWSLICGLLSLGCVGMAALHAIAVDTRTPMVAPALAPLGICAISAARAATRAIDRQPERYRGRRAAVAGAVLGWLGLAVCALSLATVLSVYLLPVVG